MSDILGVGARSNASALEHFDKATGRTVFVLDAAFGPVHAVYFTATLAQINAGYTAIAADANRKIVPVGARIKCNGSFTTLTDIRLSDTAASPVDILTLNQAQATSGAIASDQGGTGVTVGAGFGAALTSGKGVQIRQTGSAGAGGTSVEGLLLYLLV